jgi:multiple antibiotic resistance protein
MPPLPDVKSRAFFQNPELRPLARIDRIHPSAFILPIRGDIKGGDITGGDITCGNFCQIESSCRRPRFEAKVTQLIPAPFSSVVNAFLLVYAGLFPIVNPIGGAPIFLGLTRSCEQRERNQLALLVAINSFALLLGSMLVGSYVLEFFGITLPIVRVAGGLVVAATGWKLLQAENNPGGDRAAHGSGESIDAFYPLTMPLTVGPGSMAVAITLGSQRPRGGLTEIALLGMAAIVGLLAIAGTIYICYRFAEGTVGALGPRGTNVLVRLSAFILLCIGINILWSGYSALLQAAG